MISKCLKISTFRLHALLCRPIEVTRLTRALRCYDSIQMSFYLYYCAHVSILNLPI